MAQGTEVERFRSFAERYVVARASTFREGHEGEDTWACVEDAKRAYLHISQVGERDFSLKPQDQAGVSQSPPPISYYKMFHRS